MKIIEAMKRVKANIEKMEDLRNKITKNAAHLSVETPMYGDKQRETVRGWLQAFTDLSQENIRLLVAIQKTNLATEVSIEIGGKHVVKNIAEWVHRRRTYAEYDRLVWEALGDRGLKEQTVASTTGAEPTRVTIIRNFDPAERDEKVDMYRTEPHMIDSALEVVNATTDLIE